MPDMMNYLEGQLRGGGFGYSQLQQQAMLGNLRRKLREAAQARIGSTQASLARRGMLSPGQTAGISTGISSAFAKQYGQGATDIQVASAEAGRERQQWIEGLLARLEQAEKMRGAQRKASNIGGWMSLGGTVLGSALGGPLGGALGGWLFPKAGENV